MCVRLWSGIFRLDLLLSGKTGWYLLFYCLLELVIRSKIFLFIHPTHSGSFCFQRIDIFYMAHAMFLHAPRASHMSYHVQFVLG